MIENVYKFRYFGVYCDIVEPKISKHGLIKVIFAMEMGITVSTVSQILSSGNILAPAVQKIAHK